MAWLALAVPLLFLPVEENTECIPCNTLVFELRHNGKTLHEFETQEGCDAAIAVAKAWPGLECVGVWTQRYDG